MLTTSRYRPLLDECLGDDALIEIRGWFRCGWPKIRLFGLRTEEPGTGYKYGEAIAAGDLSGATPSP